MPSVQSIEGRYMNITIKNKGGRPPHEPTAQTRLMVEMMSAFGIPQDDIARVIGITSRTLRFHYFQEIDLGLLKANAKVAMNLFQIACRDNREGLDAAKFWLRMRAGWKDAAATAPDGEFGKKAAADINAKTAHQGTEWDGLVTH
jgi:hypothetical protein